MNMKYIAVTLPNESDYLKGRGNTLIRWYFYLQNGLSFLNDFHNIFLGIIALSLTFKVTDTLLLSGISVPLVIAFVFLGYWNVHHFSRIRDWLSMRFGTHYGIKTFDYNVENNAYLKEIRDLLKKIDEKTNK